MVAAIGKSEMALRTLQYLSMASNLNVLVISQLVSKYRL